MNGFRIPLGDTIATGLEWITSTFGPFFDAVRTLFRGAYDGIEWMLLTPPFWAVLLVLAGLAWLARGWKLGLGSGASLVLIYGVDQWENAMGTLSLVLVASIVAILAGIPLGILAAKSRSASAVIRPILDFMQTMPAMVYLIPALIIFRVGVVPGIVATIIFAMAPGVRFTELGIRSVDREVVEAGAAFGSTPGRILRQIQFPLALPTIMAGVNQVIMLALSMVVIAGMVGAGGLGGDVVASLNRLDPALGFEAGIAVVVLAVYLDRVTASLGNRAGRRVPAASTT
ncbi:ABC transporter permease subunit [Arthrobacter gandavensis]|uniref:ABC transporter permease n=1 Tax=Arthrobacter gandavensis TaxID=169960 RepID=UPI00188DCB4A|nr:ABC transporter permease subunit [Arthrobacter gandavensis]MBF4994910.1 ABC transporter permease subunit [Arthrobacter gandavensis]